MRATTGVLLVCALLSAPVHAQDALVYVGGSFLLSTSSSADDPPGVGYLRPNFHGSLDWPVAGLGVNGGVFITRHWDVRGELVLRRAATGDISEDEQVGHFESQHLLSRYQSSERLLSINVGRCIRTGSRVDLHPVGGFNVSFATQRLMDRHGTYTYPNGRLPVDAPDVSLQTASYGLGGGADVVIGSSSSVAFVGGGRLLWFHRTMTQSYYDRGMPPMGSYVLQIAAGVTWRPRR